ncbi:MAG: hypothetical protein IJ394_05070 [Bacteroidales bacterium]|nr:hypothetical protein [Bacteroidales bacterium]
MKKTFVLLALLYALCGCEENPVDQQNGPETFVLDKVKETSVSLLKDGAYQLTALLYGRGYNLTLTFGAEDLMIPEGEYSVLKSVSAVGECSAVLNDGRTNMTVKSGKVNVSVSDGVYNIEAEIGSVYDYIFSFEGTMEFSLDFEPSGNTLSVVESDVTMMNADWQTVIVSGVKKYTLTILDSGRNTLASIELISAPGKSLSELAGTYQVKSNSTSAGTISAASVFWGTTSGSYFVDADGNSQYITSGTVTFSVVTGQDGTDYYNIVGQGLTVTTAAGTVGSSEIGLKYLSEQALLGKIERDHKLRSEAMNRDMKYSVYLPGGYDGTKEFPVLYLLHGYGDDNNAWIDKGFLALAADAYERNGGREMIVVCPDGLTTFYYDSDQTPYETYFFTELVPEIETKFKVISDGGSRSVAGLSMGGFGSLYYALKYPSQFSYCYACSAAIDVGMGPSLYDLAAAALPSELPGITLEMGTDDYVTGDGSAFHSALQSAGIRHDYVTRSGAHDWLFWQVCLPKVLKKCGESYDYPA